MSENFYLCPIQSHHCTSKLSLGDNEFIPLKVFLKNSALNFHSHNITKTYVLLNSGDHKNRVWGYISLICSEISLDNDQRPNEVLQNQNYHIFPAVKIARLAIDKKLQGRGYGTSLIEYSISIIRELIAPYIGCRFIVVESKPKAVTFYKRAGFKLVNAPTSIKNNLSALFLDLNKIDINHFNDEENFSTNEEHLIVSVEE